jgi:hypothetical protein
MNGGRRVIEPNNKMQRITIAAFADIDRLDVTLQELVSGTVGPEQLCLIGSALHVASFRSQSRPAGSSHIHGLLGRTHPIATLSNGEQLLAAPQPFKCIDFDLERQAQGLLHGLEQILIDGALALLVESRTIPEFAAVTRALLRHSSHHVRTREVAHPQP